MPALQAAPRSISVRFGDELLQSGFTAVPNLVLSNYAALGMSSAEMLFTIQIWYHWWSKHDPHPSLKTIAGRMGVSRRQARTYAQSLRRKKLLIVRERYSENSGQTTSEYDFTPLLEEVRRHAGGVQEPQRPPRKDSSEGGRKNPSGTPRNNPSPEEDPQKEEEPSQKDNSSFRKAKIKEVGRDEPAAGYSPERQEISAYIADFARQLGDSASRKSSATRAYNLYIRSGVAFETFLEQMQASRTVTQERTASITAKGEDATYGGVRKTKMAYFFAVLEDHLGLATDRAAPGGANASV